MPLFTCLLSHVKPGSCQVPVMERGTHLVALGVRAHEAQDRQADTSHLLKIQPGQLRTAGCMHARNATSVLSMHTRVLAFEEVDSGPLSKMHTPTV